MSEMSTTPTVNTGTEQKVTAKTLPAIPEYITGTFVTEYIDACDKTIQDRFKTLCARRRITIPNTTDTLRTEQVELFMDAI